MAKILKAIGTALGFSPKEAEAAKPACCARGDAASAEASKRKSSCCAK